MASRDAPGAGGRAGLGPITPHEARHTYASLMIAASTPAKELAEYIGHASIAITVDRYGHLFESTHQDAALGLDEYLSAEV
jgi:integrase